MEALESRQLLSVVPMALPLDVATPDGTLANGTATPAAISPAEFKAAYGINQIKLDGITGDGTGQTIAIITADDAPNLVSSSNSSFDKSDLHIFDSEFGLPDPPSFTKIEQTVNGNAPAADVGWAEEASLDVEWAHAIAPEAKIVLFEAYDSTSDNLLNWGVKTAADYSGVSVVSMSFGFSEFAGENSVDADFTTPSGHNGVTFLASTGDMGAPGDYPAFSPNVVAVGGTVLNLSDGNYSSETGYDSSGGGISDYETKPSYQSGVMQSSTQRTTPDVAIDGDPQTGVDVYDSYNTGYANKWYQIAGTSLSAQVWGALIAIADQGRANDKLSTLDGPSQTLPRLYSISSSDFHDITSGYNGFSASPGYDLVTGRGSPIANVLEPALAGVPATAPTTATGSISGEVYTDSNGDGKLDDGETGLPGVTVYLDTNNSGKLVSGDPSIVTGSSGTFTFSNLPAGTYHLREVLPPEWYKLTQPSSGVYTITLSGGSKVTGENFGNYRYPPGSISGYIYLDKNDDGKYDSGDTPLAGVKIYLDSTDAGKYVVGDYYTTTNSSGYYYFGNLPPGVYHYAEMVPSGYHLSNPTSGLITVTVAPGEAVTNEDWGNVK